ncbi:hypothetical protein SLH46_03285 [Draconibacterium sp. IB214405]|uniref:golvesin C-terminal-like domain-containing protein n=1 Tax=Draconibacterium sp. IB214405 TaxID=3097352 RepID=UPI002A171FE1|nr:hypothetical protein [Draconibacterium sp. IB214405]MDX8338192.1 hypothetical protein [Draconibacterium sp. IB214405]
MISLHNIFSIAKYERKTLFRSWFFRIFSVLSLLVLFGMNFGMVIEGGGSEGWAIRAIPSAIPYFNLLILNVAQAVIAVFLASDFLKRDKKLDTTEVIYMRSMTNGEYVIGKTLGNMQVFMILNIAVVILALVFNALAKNTSIDWVSYGIYLLLISIPTLVFIMGLSFLLMSVIRNQAITFVLVLGYIGITLFLLQAKYYYIFDYMAFSIPMLSSDIVGFGNLDVLLIHRGIYFGLGAGFIFLTIFLLKRLPQSIPMTYVSLIFSLVFVGGSGYLAFNHITSFKKTEKLRTEVIELNNQYVGEPTADVVSNDIKLDHKGNSLSVTSAMTIVNNRPQPLTKLIFSLNAGLEVNDLKVDGKALPFVRKNHLILISDQVNMQPGDSAKIEFSYAGKIDEAYCYLDIEEETRLEKYGKFVLNVDKRYAFVNPDYVLLTREANWYPKTGVTYSSEDVSWYMPEFVNYTLTVNTKPGLQPVSQGEMTEVAEGQFRFQPQTPLTQLSLAIGKYELKTMEHNNFQFGVWLMQGHDYFKDVFPESKDTLASVISERFEDFKRNYDLEYNSDKLALVEVPAQFKTYERMWTSVQEVVQPGQVLIQEKGFMMREADFEKQKERMGRWRGRGGGAEMTDQDKELRVVGEFLNKFTEENETERSFSRGEMSMESSNNPYFIFPWLYNFQNNIQSDNWPITNRVFEAYLKSQTTDMRSLFMSNMNGESSEVLANIALQDYSFEEILADPDQKDIVNDVIKLKGDVLFSNVKLEAGEAEFEDFLRTVLDDNKYQNISFHDFAEQIKERFDIELEPMMNTWFKAKALPGYLVSPIKGVKVKSGDAMKTMISLKVTNFSDIDGLIKLTFRLSSGGGGGGRGFGPPGMGSEDTVDKLIKLTAHQTKELSYLFDGSPRMVIFNSLTSKNIPQTYMEMFREVEEDLKLNAWEGERISSTPVQTKLPNEEIVDNEDPGFEITENKQVSLLEKLIVTEDETEQKYASINWWRPPISWTAITGDDFFGEYVRSGYYIKGGNGEQVARWNVPVKEPGYYDVYYHFYKGRGFGRNRQQEKGSYNFIIHGDDGAEEAFLDAQSNETGWCHLGSFYFSSEKAVIELTDKTELRMIYADAVKIVEL